MSAYPTPRGGLTPADLEQVEALTYDRLNYLFDTSVTQYQWAQGATWYVDAGNLAHAMAQEHDIPAE